MVRYALATSTKVSTAEGYIMTDTTTPFDPWDWLGVHCGGYFKTLDNVFIAQLHFIKMGLALKRQSELDKLVCTLLCNTDAFEFDTDPTQLRWIGDDRFQTLDQLIEAWDCWYRERYS